MAERRSTYVFPTENDYNEFMDAIYYNDELNSCYYDSDKIYRYGRWGSEYRIDIYSDCPNPVLAASIAREHNGKYVANP